jgi:hypothetical protein
LALVRQLRDQQRERLGEPRDAERAGIQRIEAGVPEVAVSSQLPIPISREEDRDRS